MNEHALRFDISLMSKDKVCATIADTNLQIGDGGITIGSNVKMEGVSLNTTNGPFYIDEGAQLWRVNVERTSIFGKKSNHQNGYQGLFQLLHWTKCKSWRGNQ